MVSWTFAQTNHVVVQLYECVYASQTWINCDCQNFIPNLQTMACSTVAVQMSPDRGIYVLCMQVTTIIEYIISIVRFQVNTAERYEHSETPTFPASFTHSTQPYRYIPLCTNVATRSSKSLVATQN